MEADIRITEDDLAAIVQRQMTEITSLHLQNAALTRTVKERDQKIAELDKSPPGSKGDSKNAEGGKQEI